MKQRLKKMLPTVRKALSGAVPDVLYIAGCSCIVYAAWLICIALAFLIAGVLLIIAAFLTGGDTNAG